MHPSGLTTNASQPSLRRISDRNQRGCACLTPHDLDVKNSRNATTRVLLATEVNCVREVMGGVQAVAID